jgi:hypothetical protein
MHSTNNLKDNYLGSGTEIKILIRNHANLKFEILEFCDTREILSVREKEIVNMTLLSNNLCLNRQIGGGYKVGVFKHSSESKKKMSLTHTGKKMSIEAKLRMSIAKTGQILSEEHKNKISLANKNKNPWSKMSNETKNRLKTDIGNLNKLKFSKKISVNGQIFNSLNEASEKLKLHVNTIRNWAKSTDIKYINVFYVNQLTETNRENNGTS